MKRWVLSGLTGGVLALAWILTLYFLFSPSTPSENEEMEIQFEVRKFEVGSCIEHVANEPDREDWEGRPAIWKIMELGRNSYKTCLANSPPPGHCQAVLRDEAPALSISFDSEKWYQVVGCGGL